MLEMSTMYLPTNHNWLKYQSNCRNSFNDTQNILKNVLQKSADEGCEFVDFKEHVFSLLRYFFNTIFLVKLI